MEFGHMEDHINGIDFQCLVHKVLHSQSSEICLECPKVYAFFGYSFIDFNT
jgi:hypothetical protein